MSTIGTPYPLDVSPLFGPRASIPAASALRGYTYRCTDADYSYFSDGTSWAADVFGYRGVDPGTDSSVVKLSTTTPSGSTSDTSKGGINFSVGTGSGDHVEGWMKPVTVSGGGLAVALGFDQAASLTPQAGPALYDSGSGKWTIFRYAGGQLYASQYHDSTGWVSNISPIAWVNPWPRRGVFGLTFAGSAKLNVYTDNELYVPSSDINSGAGYTDTYLTSVTHVGIAGNLGAASIWFQFLKVVRT